MKKLIALLLCALLLCSLAACGGKKPAESSEPTIPQMTGFPLQSEVVLPEDVFD